MSVMEPPERAEGQELEDVVGEDAVGEDAVDEGSPADDRPDDADAEPA